MHNARGKKLTISLKTQVYSKAAHFSPIATTQGETNYYRQSPQYQPLFAFLISILTFSEALSLCFLRWGLCSNRTCSVDKAGLASKSDICLPLPLEGWAAKHIFKNWITFHCTNKRNFNHCPSLASSCATILSICQNTTYMGPSHLLR